MAKPSQYTFTLREIAINLIKSEGIVEGKWMLAFNFALGAGNIGMPEKETRPAAIVQINELMLTRQPDDAPDLPYIVDASELAEQETN